jgi:hypothetical protein
MGFGHVPRVHKQSGAVRKNHEGGIAPARVDVVNVQTTWFPFWQLLLLCFDNQTQP